MPNQHTVKKLPLPPGKKMCRTCGKILPVADFYRQYGKHASGKPRTDYKTDCKKCTVKKNNENQRIRRQKAREELKLIKEQRVIKNAKREKKAKETNG